MPPVSGLRHVSDGGMNMGLFDWIAKSRAAPAKSPPGQARTFVVGATPPDGSDGAEIITTFNDKNITFSGDVTGYDYTAILRDKQANVTGLYE